MSTPGGLQRRAQRAVGDGGHEAQSDRCGGNFCDSRSAIFSSVKPSGNVTLVYVCDGGVRSTRMHVADVIVGRSS